MYVPMVFANIWRFIAPSESKVVPYDSHVNSALLGHEIIGMRYLTSASHVVLASIALTVIVPWL